MKTFKQYLAEANNITLYRKLDGTKVVIEPDGSYTFWKDGGKTKGAQNRSLKGQQGAVKELMALGYGFGDITDESCKKISEAVLPTDNEGWGFFGTSLDYVDGTPKAEMFWEIASKVLAKERGWNPVKVRDWLDSKSGRHFADTVSDFGWSEGGIKNAYRKWDSMGWFDK